MAENLLTFRDEPLHTKEINDYLTHIQKLVNYNDNTYIKRKIDDLKGLRNEALDLEKKAYARLKVANLQELQDKIDELNAAGLDALGNRVLKTMPAYKQAQGYVTAEAVSEKLNQDFFAYMETQGMTIVGKSIEEISDSVGDFLREKGDKKRRNIVKGIDAATGRILFQFTGAQRRELGKLYDLKKSSSSVHNNSAEITVELSGRTVLNFYPYFDLSEEEKLVAKQDIEMWNHFCKAVQKCVGGSSKIQYIVRQMMDYMGIDAFVDSGGSNNDILGIFGELQGMIILRYLTGEKNRQQFLGHELDEKNRKIGIDLALDEIGFQVKNYNTLNVSGGEVFNLAGNYTLKNFLRVIDISFDGDDKSELLNGFYTLSAYHTIAKTRTKFSATRLEMNRLESELPHLYQGAIAEVLPLKEIGLTDGKTSRNVFYIIGGSRILPVSSILTMYINYLQKLVSFGSENMRKLLTVRKEYGGTTYKDYMKNGANFVGYGAVSKNIKMHFNVRTNIDRALSEVLQDESFVI